MEFAFWDVQDFHDACGVKRRNTPGFPDDPNELTLALDLIEEEDNELYLAVADQDIVALADAIADSIYVRVGLADRLGIDLPAVWDEVQRSNRAKIDPVTGKVKRREDGKILKPFDWTPPDIEKALGLASL